MQAKKQSQEQAKRDVVRRLPASARREAMMAAAAVHFAEHGFESPTRDVARTLGVTQALIYKHFASKDDLIERTLESLFARGITKGPWIDTALPLKNELLRFYLGFVSDATDLRMRLFIRAGLDGRSWPNKRGHALNAGLFLPAIAALRVEAGLPGLEAIQPMRGERELVMSLHASMVFLGIRRYIYGTTMPDRLDDVVTLYVTNFLTGATSTFRALHESGEESLKTPLASNPK